MQSRVAFAIVLLGWASPFLGSCSGPQVDPCVVDAGPGMCRRGADDGSLDIPLRDMDNWVCYSPDDHQKLVEWIKRRLSRRD